MSEIKVNSVVNSTGDNDSGLDLSTNDQVIIKTANTTAVTVDSSQNTSVSGDLTVDTSTLKVDSTNNRVGIGLTSPATKLDINFDSDSGIKFDTISGSSGTLITSYQGSNNSNVRNLEINAQNFIVETGSPTGTTTSEALRVDSDGRALIGTSSPIASSNVVTHINADAVVTGAGSILSECSGTGTVYHIHFRNGNGGVGGINTSGTSTSYVTSSDHRLKENVVDMTGAIDRVKQLSPKRFNFIADADTTVDGFLAHEAQTVVAEAVTGTHNEVDDDGNAVMQGIDQSKLVPLLTGALKEAIAKIEELETRIIALEG